MQPEVWEEAQDWLRRSGRDLLAARRVLQEPDPLPDVAVFHAQQAAEKALKAFLTAQREIFAKTHDLDLLVRQCQTFDPEFAPSPSRSNFDTVRGALSVPRKPHRARLSRSAAGYSTHH